MEQHQPLKTAGHGDPRGPSHVTQEHRSGRGVKVAVDGAPCHPGRELRASQARACPSPGQPRVEVASLRQPGAVAAGMPLLCRRPGVLRGPLGRAQGHASHYDAHCTRERPYVPSIGQDRRRRAADPLSRVHPGIRPGGRRSPRESGSPGECRPTAEYARHPRHAWDASEYPRTGHPRRDPEPSRGPDPTNPAQRALSRLARLLCQRRVASGNCGSKARRRGRRPAPSRSNGPGSRRPAAPVRASRMSPCRPGLRPGNGGVLLWDGPSRRVRGSGPTAWITPCRGTVCPYSPGHQVSRPADAAPSAGPPSPGVPRVPASWRRPALRIVFESIAWKTARFREVQTAPYRSY